MSSDTPGSGTPEPALPLSAPATPSVFQRWGRNGTAIVVALAAVVLLLIGGTIGLALGSNPAPSSESLTPPAADSVDVGFLRDMTVHHEQGVLLAHLVQLNGGQAEVAGIGYDIEYQQTSQIGQMGGFLQLWGYSLNNLATPMSWMASSDMNAMAGMPGMTGSSPMTAMTTMDAASVAAGAIMPGMATNAEVDRLKTLRGDASDAYFLQLMIRHHQGGVPMMDYAATYATNPVVKNMALKMAQGQVAEIASMTQLLQTTYGEQPLTTSGVVASGEVPSGTDSTSAEGSAGMSGMTGMEMPPTS